MNEKEIAEIKKSLSKEKNAITSVCGCYVNANGEMIAKFNRSAGLMDDDEFEKYISIFKRTLSGTLNKNLLDISFSASQVENSDEHKLLMSLKDSELTDGKALDTLYEKISASVSFDDNYVILLTLNKYDVPFKATDGFELDEVSDRVYTYIVCSICPVRSTKAALTYDPSSKSFRNNSGDNAISSPEVGFLFPAFDTRRTNIYDALLYTKSTGDAHEELTSSVFGNKIKMPADEQNQIFRSLLAESLEDDCSFKVARAVHCRICEKIEEHKASHEEEPLAISRVLMKEFLGECGIGEEKLESFEKHYNESFGIGTNLVPKNIVDPKKFELKTGEIVIKVTPGHSDLIETRIIDGVKYILIRADEGAELNGLNIKITE